MMMMSRGANSWELWSALAKKTASLDLQRVPWNSLLQLISMPSGSHAMRTLFSFILYLRIFRMRLNRRYLWTSNGEGHYSSATVTAMCYLLTPNFTWVVAHGVCLDG